MSKRDFTNSVTLFRAKGGILQMTEALRLGISRKTLYAMLESGVIERLSRGIYRLTELPSLDTPDLVTVAARVPQGIIYLISALAYHELTTQVPLEPDKTFYPLEDTL